MIYSVLDNTALKCVRTFSSTANALLSKPRLKLELILSFGLTMDREGREGKWVKARELMTDIEI